MYRLAFFWVNFGLAFWHFCPFAFDQKIDFRHKVILKTNFSIILNLAHVWSGGRLPPWLVTTIQMRQVNERSGAILCNNRYLLILLN